MRKNAHSSGFTVHFDPSKHTSGRRFFENLAQALASEAASPEQRPAAVLFNISAPLGKVIGAKLRGQKVVLRVDGLYFDRLSRPFLESFRWPVRQFLSLGLKYGWARDALTDLANVLNQNYTAFSRILLADMLVYQSRYSRDVHARYFPRKPYRIIVNGSTYQAKDEPAQAAVANEPIRIVTIYDDWKPAKRIVDLVRFVHWACEVKKANLQLTILGYTGKLSAGLSPAAKTLIETSPHLRTIPRFNALSGEVRSALLGADLYMTFTYRDPCPNAVVEAMAHGLPVVGIASGGLPDIVGNAGVLIQDSDAHGFFSCSRYESDFPSVDFEEALSAVLNVKHNASLFRARTRERFETDLDIKLVARRYVEAVRSSLGYAHTATKQAGTEP